MVHNTAIFIYDKVEEEELLGMDAVCLRYFYGQMEMKSAVILEYVVFSGESRL